MARYCTYCGKPVKEKNKFCTHCGKSILYKIPQAERKTQDVIPEIQHEKIFEKVEEITDEDRSEESIYSKPMKLEFDFFSWNFCIRIVLINHFNFI